MLSVRLRLRWRRIAPNTKTASKSMPPTQGSASTWNHPRIVASSHRPPAVIDANKMPLQFLAVFPYAFHVSWFRMIVALGAKARAI